LLSVFGFVAIVIVLFCNSKHGILAVFNGQTYPVHNKVPSIPYKFNFSSVLN